MPRRHFAEGWRSHRGPAGFVRSAFTSDRAVSVAVRHDLPVRYDVAIAELPARPTAVVAATTTWDAFPRLWPILLDEVWAWLRANGINRGCRNLMLYLDDEPRVEVGVLMLRPLPALRGRVVASSLPAGRVASTSHRGPYSELGAAHEAVLAWCRERGEIPAGPHWEVYGPHRDDPAELTTEVGYLLGPAPG
jgi:effector-binding domain-containing protein